MASLALSSRALASGESFSIGGGGCFNPSRFSNFGLSTCQRKYTTATQAMNRMMQAIDIQATILLGCLGGFGGLGSRADARTPEVPPARTAGAAGLDFPAVFTALPEAEEALAGFAPADAALATGLAPGLIPETAF